jgi:8-oxo-dGTP diphosphatase
MTKINESKVLEFGVKIPEKIYIDRPGAYAVLLGEDGLIGVVRNSKGYFLIGGGIDNNESPEEALHREVKEEIGGEIEIISKIGEAIEHSFADELNQYFTKYGYFYKAIVLKTGVGEADHELQWLSFDEALSKLVPLSQKWAVNNKG